MGLLGGCAGPGSGSATTPAQACAGELDEAAVVAVLDGQREAWNAGDIDGFLAGYEPSERLLFTSGAQIRRGYAETAAKFKARYGEAPQTMGTLAFEILDVRGLGTCPVAIVLGRWALTDTPAAGSGVFSVVLERQADGVWRIVHDHTSADPAS